MEVPLTALKRGESGIITSIRASSRWGKMLGMGLPKKTCGHGFNAGHKGDHD